MTLVRKIHDMFNKVIKLEDNCYQLTVCMGIASFPNHGKTIEELMKYSEIALYEAKNKGKNKSVLYNVVMNKKFLDKLFFQRRLKKALNDKGFYLNYQPL